MAERGALAGGEGRGKPACLARQDGNEGIDAAVHPVQPTAATRRVIWLRTRPAAGAAISVIRPCWRSRKRRDTLVRRGGVSVGLLY